MGVVLVVDTNGLLLGTATDGDIRRALLLGPDLDSPVKDAMNSNPIVAPETLPDSALLTLMRANTIRHLPLVDGEGPVVAMGYLEVAPVSGVDCWTAIVMAGGEGQRLRPLTETIPKPMLPVGGRPVLEILLDSLRVSGFGRVLISVGYLRSVIQDHFGDGSQYGLEVEYLVEEEPLGTAGALGLISQDRRPATPFLVVNGDLLTSLSFAAFRDFHIAADYDLTLCCRPYEIQVPYGYPVVEGDLVTSFREKPTFHYLVNSGIYCLSPELLDRVPQATAYNMNDLIDTLCEAKACRVGVFPLREPFHEIGQLEAYDDAEKFYSAHVSPGLGSRPNKDRG